MAFGYNSNKIVEEVNFAMIQWTKSPAMQKIDHLKFSLLLARWQEIVDPLETYNIGWAYIQLHYHIVKVC